MTDIDALQLRSAELQRKLSRRSGAPGFEANAREIEAELKAVDQEIARQRAQGSERPSPQPLT